MENLDDLEYRLRNLLREWGSDVARMAFEHATATLHIAERNRIEARIFGDVPVSSAAGAGSLAAPSVLSGNGHGQHSQLISNDDIYQQYEAGVKHLLHLIDREHQHYYDLLIYQQRLHENLSRARRYGHDPTLRAERAEILAYLNEMAIAIAGYSFQEVHQRLATSDTSNHGVSLQLVQGFFGTGGIPNGKALIDSYLEVLIERYGAVRFGRLLAASASEPRGTEVPALALQQVYVSLTTGNDIPGERFVIDADTLLAELEAGDPEQVPAEAVRLASVGAQSGTADQQQQTGVGLERNGIVPSSYQQLARQALPAQLSGCWYRPELVIEAIANCSRLVLLGAPGSGKTTILHYLVVTLAQRLLQRDQSDASAVWRHHVDQLLQPGIPIPIFCSLGRVAAQFGHDPSADIHTLLVTLLSSVVETTRWVVPSTTVLLAWRQGHVILCFDGLDDVSNVLVETSRGLLSPRQRMVKALDQLSDQVGRSRMVVTCRTPAYHQYASARLSDTWRIRTIQPLHMGQVRQFITTWHQNVSQLPQSPWTPDAAQARARDLLRTLEHLPGLRELTTSPLLLTMLVLLDYHARECTAARVDMYEELVQLLLERWHLIRTTRHEQQAQPTSDRHGLEQINRSNLRSIIHEIAFEAHRSTSSGPGGLSVAAMRQRIDHFLPGRSIQRHLGGCPVRSMWR